MKNNTVKRFIAYGLITCMAVSLLGCSEKEKNEEKPTVTEAPLSPEVTMTPEPTKAPEKVEYNPSESRLEGLVLSSSDLDQYTFNPDDFKSNYDESFTVTVEAEEASLTGDAFVDSVVTGYTGSGYVEIKDAGTGDSAMVSLSIPASGTYTLTFRIATPYGEKDNYIFIDEENVGTVSCPETTTEFKEYTVNGVYIKEGDHSIGLSAFWGWCQFDSIRVDAEKQAVIDLTPKELTTVTLVDKYATLRTKMLYQFVCDMDGQYILSGQYADAGMASNEFMSIYEETGRYPAMLGLDLIDYSPSRAAQGATSYAVKKAIDFYQKEGGIVTLAWHWNAPSQYITDLENWWKGFYQEYVNMDLRAIMNGEDEAGYDALIHDIDCIAFYLKQIAEEDVPILWRPLHEASGGWFWWGNYGSEAYIKLWRTMYKRLVEYHGIHNLIWVWNGQAADWYPGDGFVDIIGEDIYPGNHVYGSQSAKYAEAAAYTSKEKPIALSENGCLFDPDLAIRDNSRWTWFCTWSGEFTVDAGHISETYTEKAMWDKVFNHSSVITLDELPDLTTYGQ